MTLTEEEITVMLGDTKLRYGIDYVVSYENNTSNGRATAIVTGLGQYGYTGTAEAEFTIKVTEPAEPELTGISVKEPCKVNYTVGENLDPTGLVLELSYDDDTTDTVIYSDETAADFTFNPALDTALTADMKVVTVEYAGMTTTFDIRVSAAPVTITDVKLEAGPDKTEYTEGETLDPAGLVLKVSYSDGTEGTIGYNAETAARFAFTPALGTALATDDKEVTVTYQNHTVTFGITVNAKATDPEDPDPEKPDPEDPDQPDPQKPGGTDGGSSGSQTDSGDKAVQTGDTSNAALWAASAAIAGAALVIAGRKRRTEK